MLQKIIKRGKRTTLPRPIKTPTKKTAKKTGTSGVKKVTLGAKNMNFQPCNVMLKKPDKTHKTPMRVISMCSDSKAVDLKPENITLVVKDDNGKPEIIKLSDCVII